MLLRSRLGLSQFYNFPMRYSSDHIKTHDKTIKYPSKNLEEAILTNEYTDHNA